MAVDRTTDHDDDDDDDDGEVGERRGNSIATLSFVWPHLVPHTRIQLSSLHVIRCFVFVDFRILTIDLLPTLLPPHPLRSNAVWRDLKLYELLFIY